MIKNYKKVYSEEKLKNLTLRDILENKKVIVKYRPEKFNPIFTALDPNHVCRDVMPGGAITLTLPLDKSTGKLVQILHEEEIAIFEKLFQLQPGSMNFYNTKNMDSYWQSKQSRVALTGEPLYLDLSNPIDYIKYLVLLVNDDIVAPSWELRGDYPSCKWAIVDEAYEDKKTSTNTMLKMEAYNYLNQIKSNKERLIDVFKLMGKTYPPTVSLDTLISELSQIIEQTTIRNGVLTIHDFLQVMQDDKAQTKVLIEDLIKLGEIVKSKGQYKLKGGDTIGGLEAMVNFLEAPANLEILQSYKIKVKQSKSE